MGEHGTQISHPCCDYSEFTDDHVAPGGLEGGALCQPQGRSPLPGNEAAAMAAVQAWWQQAQTCRPRMAVAQSSYTGQCRTAACPRQQQLWQQAQTATLLTAVAIPRCAWCCGGRMLPAARSWSSCCPLLATREGWRVWSRPGGGRGCRRRRGDTQGSIRQRRAGGGGGSSSGGGGPAAQGSGGSSSSSEEHVPECSLDVSMRAGCSVMWPLEEHEPECRGDAAG